MLALRHRRRPIGVPLTEHIQLEGVYKEPAAVVGDSYLYPPVRFFFPAQFINPTHRCALVILSTAHTF